MSSLYQQTPQNSKQQHILQQMSESRDEHDTDVAAWVRALVSPQRLAVVRDTHAEGMLNQELLLDSILSTIGNATTASRVIARRATLPPLFSEDRHPESMLEPRPLAPSLCFVACSSNPQDEKGALAFDMRSSPSLSSSSSSPTLSSTSSTASSRSPTRRTLPRRRYSLQQNYRSSLSSARPSSSFSRCASSRRGQHRLLPEFFIPGPYTVVIGRGREARQAEGNRRLREIGATFLDDYAMLAPEDKPRKSEVVARVRETVRELNPLGAFVRLGSDGRWYEVPDAVATEKVGYTMRELVGEKYQSSSRAKQIARQNSFVEPLDDYSGAPIKRQGLMRSNLRTR